MPTYLEIAVNVPQVAGVFHYHLPPELEGRLDAGYLVEVPFGRQMVQGVVLRPVEEPEVAETRPVSEILDPQPVLTPSQIALARQLAESTLSPLAAIVNLMLPPGLGQQADVQYSVVSQPSPEIRNPKSEILPPQSEIRNSKSVLQTRLLKLLTERGPLRGRQIDAAMPRLDWRPTAQKLVKQGLLVAQSVLPTPTVRPRTVRTAQLACPPEIAEVALPDLSRAGSQALARRQAMLRYLLREPGPVDVAWIYAESGGKLDDLHALAERGLVILGESETWRDPLAGLDFIPTGPPPLTRDQRSAWAEVCSGMQAAAAGQAVLPYLLHGVTGSGKTEIYLHAVEEAIRLGKQAIVLVPEIALTPQTVRRFVSRFPGRVGLVHSSLSQGERYDTWRRARAGLLSVVVGPRSALFTPFPRLGLIVVDECHDDSYYQSEPPFYHARDAALMYARLAGAVCLMGTATPDIVTRQRAELGEYCYLSLPARILAHRQAVQAQVEKLHITSLYRPLDEQAETIDLPAVQVVDMRSELQAGNTSIFSRSLQEALTQVLTRGQQAILFLNRRGTATYVFCRDCGGTLQCPRCDLPLTLHVSTLARSNVEPVNVQPANVKRADVQRANVERADVQPANVLTCHHCGYTRKMPTHCPTCGSLKIRQYGTGTEKVETEVQQLLPGVRTLRWDYETTRQKGAHEMILSHFSNGRADVLVGTQMIAKGLDLPLVTLVGVVLADVGLNMPDYRAAERTFNVLTQVAGRAGRSPLGGQVILQTFQPDHYVIQAAALHDYESFYRQELALRRKLGYPPFGRLVRLEFRHAHNAEAEAAAQGMAAQLRGWMADAGRRATDLIGPAPCFFARVGGMYRWQVILRGPDPASLLHERSLGGWRVEVNPVSLL